MRQAILFIARNLAKRGGLYSPARFFYNTIFYSRARRTVKVENCSCTFWTPTPTIAEHVVSLTDEKELLQHLLKGLLPDDVVWDIGASFGLYTCFVSAKLGERGKVYAFEPEPRMRKLLGRNVALNRCRNVSVLPCALGSTDAETILYQSDSPNAGTSALTQRTDYRVKAQGINVLLRRGDSLVNEHTVSVPTILKIDVEGAEAQVLGGMGHLLRNNSLRALYCEVHPHLLPLFGDTAAGVEHCITEAGFTIAERHSRGTEYHIICLRGSSS